jgi:hypothetical protein
MGRRADYLSGNRSAEDTVKDKQLEALIRKTTGKATSDKARKARFIDPTLEATKRPQEEEGDSEKLFKEMKKREF